MITLTLKTAVTPDREILLLLTDSAGRCIRQLVLDIDEAELLSGELDACARLARSMEENGVPISPDVRRAA